MYKLSIGALFLLLPLLLPSPASSSETLWGIKLDGFIESDLAFDLKNDESSRYLENGINLNGRFRLGGEYRSAFGLLARLSVQGRGHLYDLSDHTHYARKVRPYEVYLNFSRGNLGLRIGKQIFAWGKADEINPTDNLNPHDFYEFAVSEREERKIPVWALKAEYYLGAYKVEGIWVPYFEEMDSADRETDWQTWPQRGLKSLQAIPGFRLEEKEPPDNARSSTVAFKLSQSSSAWDGSVSYLYGWDFEPFARLGGRPFPLQIRLRNSRIHVLGTDFSVPYRQVVLKGEAAYFLGSHFATELNARDRDRVVTRDALFYALGVEYLWRGKTYLNSQLVQLVIPHHDREMEDEQVYSMATFLVQDHFWEDTLWVKLRIGYDITDRGYYLQPRVSYDLRQGWSLIWGADIFGGKGDRTLFGQFDRNDQVFLKLRYDL